MNYSYNPPSPGSYLSSLDNYFLALPENEVLKEARELIQPVLEFRTVLKREEIHITLLGVFKAGKSTLINALLGSKVVPSRVNRATGVVTKIGYASQPSATISFKASNGDLSEQEIAFNNLDKYILLDLSEGNSDPPEGIEEVVIRFPFFFCNQRCIFVDTPGLEDTSLLDERIYQEVEKSDLVIMVLLADKLLSEVEKETAREIHDLLDGNIVFVINRLGLTEQEDRDVLFEWAETTLAGLENPLVGRLCLFTADAKTTLEARLGNLPGENYFGDLIVFQRWLEELLNTAACEKVAIISRLGILHNHLFKARSILEIRLAELEANVKSLKQEQEITYVKEIAILRSRVEEDRLHVSQVYSEVYKLGDSFISDCIQNAKQMMNTSSDWSTKLKNCFSKAILEYTWKVNQKVKSAISQTPVEIPDFSIGFYSVPIPELANVTGSGVKGWFRRNFFEEDAKNKAIDSIKQTSRGMLAILYASASQYIDDVDRLLASYGDSYIPSISNLDYQTAQQLLQDYSVLVDWCDQFQREINNIRGKIKGGLKMSWESEFSAQWKTFLDILENRIRREIANSGSVDLTLINSVIRSEGDKWSMSSHYNGAWLRNLKRAHPSLGDSFQSTIEQLRLDKLKIPGNKGFLLYIPIVIALVILVVFILHWQGVALKGRVIGAGVVFLVALPLLLALESRRSKQKAELVIKMVQEKLDPLKQKLLDVVMKADQLSSEDV